MHAINKQSYVQAKRCTHLDTAVHKQRPSLFFCRSCRQGQDCVVGFHLLALHHRQAVPSIEPGHYFKLHVWWNQLMLPLVWMLLVPRHRRRRRHLLRRQPQLVWRRGAIPGWECACRLVSGLVGSCNQEHFYHNHRNRTTAIITHAYMYVHTKQHGMHTTMRIIKKGSTSANVTTHLLRARAANRLKKVTSE